jgi:hypothetical protein
MRSLLILPLALLSLGSSVFAGDFKLYAVFIEDTRVELSDGAVWMMDKGDVFPIQAYKNMQKNVILQIAGATFTTDTDRIRVLKPEEVPAGIETYRNNVRAYLESTSKKMLEKLQDKPAAKAEPKTEEKPAEEKVKDAPTAEKGR